MKPFIALIIYLVLFGQFQAHAQENNDHAIILNYTRIGEQSYPDTNTLIDQFKAQIDYLDAEDFNLVALKDVVEALNNEQTLPDKSVAITFDGGYASIMSVMPYILKHDIPVTIFLALGAIDQDSPQFLSEKDIKKLAKQDHIDFQLSSYGFKRMPLEKEGILSQINLAKSAYRKLFDKEPEYFAYPYGEYNSLAAQTLEQQGFKAAFAQHSSPASAHTDFYGLPRFAMSEEYGDLERFSLIAHSYPLNVTQFSPDNPMLEETAPAIGFTLSEPLKNKDDLSCYLSNQGSVDLTFLDETRIEIRLSEPLTDRRSRLNCTYPFVKDDTRYWKWFGRLFILPQVELLSLLE
jgi:peptidoglycan/xylan/chitin deacetylase (PgdA/CDA1 family)